MEIKLETIGYQIQSLRKTKGYTQNQLGDMIGVSFQAVSKWERGEALPDIATFAILAEVLDTTIDNLLHGGKKITEYRQRYIETLNDFLPKVYDGISAGREELTTKYLFSFSGDFLEALKNARQEDMYTGVTSIGPHRDDIDFKINGISARKFGSQGQKRSVALAVKLAEAEVITKNTGECPIILLDDVMSELDPSRQEYILNHIKDTQVFITCCDPENIKGLIAGKVIKVENGEVK